jgi:hypothetical protein
VQPGAGRRVRGLVWPVRARNSRKVVATVTYERSATVINVSPEALRDLAEAFNTALRDMLNGRGPGTHPLVVTLSIRHEGDITP